MEGPIRGIRFIHKAIRTEVADLEDFAREFALGNRRDREELTRRLNFLETVVHMHAQGEDDVWFPALDGKAPMVTQSYVLDHRADETRFARINALLAEIAAGTEDARRGAAWQLHREIVSLNATLSAHVWKEEEQLVPLTEERFSFEEQEQISGNAIRHVPPELNLDMAPWMLRALTPDEQEQNLRMIMAAAPPQAFQEIVGRVRRDLPMESWAEIVQRIPELKSMAA